MKFYLRITFGGCSLGVLAAAAIGIAIALRERQYERTWAHGE